MAHFFGLGVGSRLTNKSETPHSLVDPENDERRISASDLHPLPVEKRKRGEKKEKNNAAAAAAAAWERFVSTHAKSFKPGARNNYAVVWQ